MQKTGKKQNLTKNSAQVLRVHRDQHAHSTTAEPWRATSIPGVKHLGLSSSTQLYNAQLVSLRSLSSSLRLVSLAGSCSFLFPVLPQTRDMVALDTLFSGFYGTVCSSLFALPPFLLPLHHPLPPFAQLQTIAHLTPDFTSSSSHASLLGWRPLSLLSTHSTFQARSLQIPSRCHLPPFTHCHSSLNSGGCIS